MSDSIRDKINKARSLRSSGSYAESLKIIDELEEGEGLSPEDEVLCLILKGDINIRIRNFDDARTIAEQAYNKAQILENPIRSVDALFIIHWSWLYTGNPDESFKIISQAEKILDAITGESSIRISRRKVELLYAKSAFFQQKQDYDKAMDYAEKNLEINKKLKNEYGIVQCFTQISNILISKGDYDQALDYTEKNLEIKKKLGNEVEIAECFLTIAEILLNKNNYDKALEYAEKSLELSKKLSNRAGIARSFYIIAHILEFKQDLERAFEYNEKSLELYEKLNNKRRISNCFLQFADIMWIKGDFDKALDYAKKGLEIAKEIHLKLMIGFCLSSISSSLAGKNEFEKALVYAKQGLEIYRKLGVVPFIALNLSFIVELVSNFSFKETNEWLQCLEDFVGKESMVFRSTKANVLMLSKRARDLTEAERLLKKIIKDEKKPLGPNSRWLRFDHGPNSALIRLCWMHIKELESTGQLEILEDIHPLIEKLIEKCKNDNSYALLAETKLLHAKISMIQMNLEDARRLLTEAQKIATDRGIGVLAAYISTEHDRLLDELNKWNEFKRRDAPISERLKLASVAEVTESMLERRAVKVPEIEIEQPVSMVVFSKTGYKVFSSHFTADPVFDEKLIGNMVSMINQANSESLDRLKIGEFTVLLNVVDLFSICYVFRGQSYSAGQKLTNFTEAVKDNKGILKTLDGAVRTGQSVEIADNPDLEELITECFMADPKKFKLPFNAYKGDKPFVFISYAHADKLQVYPIIDYLHRSGFNVWYDEGISPSEDWMDSIVNNIENCTVFLVFISPHILDSKYVRKEISFALEIDKPFYAVFLKDTALPSRLRFEISGIQHMKKYIMPDNEFYDKIKEVLSPVLSDNK